jgi:hypothetical protein
MVKQHKLYSKIKIWAPKESIYEGVPIIKLFVPKQASFPVILVLSNIFNDIHELRQRKTEWFLLKI